MKRKTGTRHYSRMVPIDAWALAKLRASKFTQERLLEKAGITISNISDAENGRPVSERVAEVIARELGKPVKALFQRVANIRSPEDNQRAKRRKQRTLLKDKGGRREDVPKGFEKIFGGDHEVFLIYSELTLNSLVPQIIDAYEKLLRQAGPNALAVADPELRTRLKEKPLVTYDLAGNHGKDGYNFRAEHSACVCEVRAAAYLAAAFSKLRYVDYRVVGNAHSEIYGKADLSFVSFGTLINSKSQELLADSTALVGFEEGRFVSKRLELTGQPSDGKPRFLHEPVNDSSEYDYGVIIRMHPVDVEVEPSRVWIACAGVQQKGTSAAARVLATSWNKIAEQLRHNTGQFVCLVRTPKHSTKGDEFARLQWIVERAEDLEQWELPE